jgi:hypothetical protein
MRACVEAVLGDCLVYLRGLDPALDAIALGDDTEPLIEALVAWDLGLAHRLASRAIDEQTLGARLSRAPGRGVAKRGR